MGLIEVPHFRFWRVWCTGLRKRKGAKLSVFCWSILHFDMVWYVSQEATNRGTHFFWHRPVVHLTKQKYIGASCVLFVSATSLLPWSMILFPSVATDTKAVGGLVSEMGRKNRDGRMRSAALRLLPLLLSMTEAKKGSSLFPATPNQIHGLSL